MSTEVVVTRAHVMYATCSACSDRYGHVIRIRSQEIRLCVKHAAELKRGLK